MSSFMDPTLRSPISASSSTRQVVSPPRSPSMEQSPRGLRSLSPPSVEDIWKKLQVLKFDTSDHPKIVLSSANSPSCESSPGGQSPRIPSTSPGMSPEKVRRVAKGVRPFPVSSSIPIKNSLYEKAEEIFPKRRRSSPQALSPPMELRPKRCYSSLSPEDAMNEIMQRQEILRQTRTVLNAKLPSPCSEDISPDLSPLSIRDSKYSTRSIPPTPLGTPPTPCNTVRRRSLTEFAQKVLQIAMHREFEFQTENGLVKFKIKRPCLGKGDYSEVFEIAEGQPQLFSSFKNNQILFKRYQKRLVEARGNNVINFFKYSMDQYDQLESLGYPIAKILNRKTAKKDGFFIVEKIPHAFPQSIDYASCDKIEMYVDQVARMFQIAFDHKIPVDLKRQNVKIKDDGTVTLIDFREEHSPLSILIENMIESFADDSEEIAEKLRPKKSDAVNSEQALSLFTNF